MVSEKKIFFLNFKSIPFINQIKRFGHKTYETWRTTHGHIREKKFKYLQQKMTAEQQTAENVNFHFSHYKSMGTISCQSNQTSYQTGIKHTIYVTANVLNMYVKFPLHPPYGF